MDEDKRTMEEIIQSYLGEAEAFVAYLVKSFSLLEVIQEDPTRKESSLDVAKKYSAECNNHKEALNIKGEIMINSLRQALKGEKIQ